MSDKTELLPCPFCGGEMKLDPGAASFARGPGEVYVTCDCGAMGAGGKTPDEAIAVWNRRATIQPTAAIAALQSIKEMTDANDPESYRCDDREGCLDTVFAVASEALSGVAPADAVRDTQNERDAARYRYLRATTKAIRNDEGTERMECTPEQFDAAIDAGMKPTQKEPPK
jgi:hypothetical protein